ncbi:MAG: AFG1 family ATPase [Chromatiales bacterium]|nr:AFG1 family ATPase [Chromatiales bacterium]
MQLQDRYTRALEEHGLAHDSVQWETLASLERVRATLCARHPANGGWLARFLGRRRPAAPVTGAYLWGGVGRGKTFMMDLFYTSLPFEDKLRQHFHRLMYRVHGRLRELRSEPDPLRAVAREIAGRARVLCFDEFFVNDIADAMILGKLLEHLFEHGVTLVATSNIHPAGLYAGGLQRQRFLPAIDLITRHTEVLHVDGPVDYRLRLLERAEIYHSPLDEAAELNLERYFHQMAPEAGLRDTSIEIHGREIPMRRRADGIAWFEFAALCDGPRSQDDYIEIARCFQTVILSGVPLLDELRENEARRLVALVDEFYERRVKLIISAAVPLGDLYQGERLAGPFIRTRSRLEEMQSREYLATAHLP